MLSRELRKGKNIIAIILLMILLTIPLGGYVHHTKPYYIIAIFVFIPLVSYKILRNDHLEKRFYLKWGKNRRKGRLTNMFSEGIRTTFFIVAIVFSGQFIINNRTPSFIFSQLSINGITYLMLITLIFGAIGGIAAWYENEKRYARIYFNSKDNEK